MASGMDRRACLPGGLKAERIELVGDTVLIHTRAKGESAACPGCGEISRNIHSHYQRDRPVKVLWQGVGGSGYAACAA
jgi:hypothetical protein